MEQSHFRKLYDQYAAAVAYIEVQEKESDPNIGSAFHVGGGVFVTARHVVEGKKILSIATTEHRVDSIENNEMAYTISSFPGEGQIKAGPFYHPDPKVDVAALVVDGIRAPRIPLGFHMDEMIDNGLVLAPVLVMGYPRIPLSFGPTLVASVGQVNAVIDKYTGGHPHFIVSTMARGGFSGGVAIAYDFVLGVITESLNANYQPVELGYQTVLTVEPIYVCLAHHNIMPQDILQDWAEGRNKGRFWADLTSHRNRSVVALIAKDLDEIIANEPDTERLQQRIDEYISSRLKQQDNPTDIQTD